MTSDNRKVKVTAAELVCVSASGALGLPEMEMIKSQILKLR